MTFSQQEGCQKEAKDAQQQESHVAQQKTQDAHVTQQRAADVIISSVTSCGAGRRQTAGSSAHSMMTQEREKKLK